MSKLNVNQSIRNKLAQEIKAAQNEKRARTRYEADKIATKKRGDEIRGSIEIELLQHSDKLYYESLLDE